MANHVNGTALRAYAPLADLKTLGDRLVGTWALSGDVEGETTWEWMEGGYFLIQRGWTRRDGVERRYVQVIGHDRMLGFEPAEAITGRLYTDHGDTHTYVCECEGDDLTIWMDEKGAPAVYTGRFSLDGDTIDGVWLWPGGGYVQTMNRVAS